jgi:hypothetical protein
MPPREDLDGNKLAVMRLAQLDDVPSTLCPNDGPPSPCDCDVRDVMLEGGVAAAGPQSSPETDRTRRTARLLHGRDVTLLQLGWGNEEEVEAKDPSREQQARLGTLP